MLAKPKIHQFDPLLAGIGIQKEIAPFKHFNECQVLQRENKMSKLTTQAIILDLLLHLESGHEVENDRNQIAYQHDASSSSDCKNLFTRLHQSVDLPDVQRAC